MTDGSMVINMQCTAPAADLVFADPRTLEGLFALAPGFIKGP